MCCTIKILIQTDLGRENSASYYGEDSCFWLFSPWSRVGHRGLCPIFMLWLVKIWQVSSCGKFMQHLETCLLWQLYAFDWLWRSFVSTCDVFNCLFALNVQNETAAIKSPLLSLLLFMARLFIGLLVEKCVACQSRKYDFGWHRFHFSLSFMMVKSLKRSWPSRILSLSNYCISCLFFLYLMSWSQA